MRPMCTKTLKAIAGAFALGGFLFSTPILANSNTHASLNFDMSKEVDLELVLAVDISQSMDPEEQRVQREGYVAALTSDEVLDAIKYGPIGRIAVAYMEWGGKDEHFVVADWTIISDKASAGKFAGKIAEAPLRRVQRTSISSALTQAVNLVTANEYNGMRRVIDISGDGPNNQGSAVTEARDAAIAQGVTVNGLPLMLKEESISWQSMLHLDHYYEDCVIGGPGAFSIPVRSKEGFSDAIRMKLVLEIAGLVDDQPKFIRAKSRRDAVMCSLFD
ncbi:DUF1194 domain-containing protein [Pseudovibrio brasiliensis]|nr:DUF1194 domain-containing protein [Pseudovibrio brasiliensis]